MRRDVHGNACKFRVFVNHKAYGLFRQAVSEAVDKQPSALGNLMFKGGYIRRKRGDDVRIANLYNAFLGAFSPDKQGTVFYINVFIFQIAKL